jgi:hypothetical protein
MAEEARPESGEITIHVSSSGLKVNLPAGYAKDITPSGDVEGHEFDEENTDERMFHVNAGCCE